MARTILLGLIMLGLAGCGGKPSPEPLREPTKDEVAASAGLAEAENDFGLSIKNAVLPKKGSVNFCFSPLSLHQALCLLLNGASGSTRAVLEKELGGAKGLGVDKINAGSYGLLGQLGPDFTIANSVWMPPEAKPKQSYVDVLHESYNAEFFDGGAFDAKTVGEVNEWVKDKTRGMIPAIVDEFPSATAVVLVNAIAFDGKWQHPFKPERTEEAPFTLGSGDKVSAPMMRQSEDFNYAELNGTKAIWVDYQGSPVSFVALLPPEKENALEYLRKLDGAAWNKLISQRKSRTVDLSLPRFEMRVGGDLTDVLRNTGLKPLFQGLDLSAASDGLAGRDLSLSQVVQKCFIAVDEEGTKAAAATEMAAAGGAMMPGETVRLVLDRPFVFALVHGPTNAIVMIGVVNDPRG